MTKALPFNEEESLRRLIISQCVWSDTYSSLKHILKRTANRLPLLVSFCSDNNEQKISNDNNDHTILFFDRNVSKKILFTPLRQLEDKQNQFEVYPRHCTFAVTDSFRGIFEFVRNGRRCSHIYTNLEQLVNYAASIKCTATFMSRDHIQGYYEDSNSSRWTSKKYPQGAVFQAQYNHRSSDQFHRDRRINVDYVKCLDEDGYNIFLKINHSGRFSLIATSIDQQKIQPEKFLHFIQTPNIDKLIQRLILDKNNMNCIRLVRGPVPHNFICQYLKFVRQHTYDVLVGLTKEGLVIEWNIESYVSCRYATNFDDILNNLYGTWEEQTLESYMDYARTHYRENFQNNVQLLSKRDWTALFQYWKWTGDICQINNSDKNIPDQSCREFHLVTSIQDISDDAERLSSELKKSIIHHHKSQSIQEIHHKHDRKVLSSKERLFLTGISPTVPSKSSQKQDRISLPHPRSISLQRTKHEKLFDDSIYDSNHNYQSLSNKIQFNFDKRNARRTQ
ncbi:unnamed protein product [Rotaria sp. Silwood2]|nr:unnamed protein product [Rotaria sp. Silwood2]